jgi:uncharacterized protein with PIN domain
MVTATFRFYGELNDFLARERRSRDVSVPCARAATTKHMIEALGVPHTEVELVLLNGAPSTLDDPIGDGDRVAVYPRFTRIDVSGVARTVTQPAGRMRFTADAHLGGLARLLRMAGFDTIYRNDIDDAEIAALAAGEGRVALTRDRDLLKRRGVDFGCYVRALRTPEQLREVVLRYGLADRARPFTLCLHCNAPLRHIARADVTDRVPPRVRDTQDEFRTCDCCTRVYWRGTHWERMRAVLAQALIDDAAADVH